jgi:hypothetical protein
MKVMQSQSTKSDSRQVTILCAVSESCEFLRWPSLALFHMCLTVQRDIYTVFIVPAYQTSQYLEPHGGIFLGKWRSSFAGSSDGKMNAQSACALNTRYTEVHVIDRRSQHP